MELISKERLIDELVKIAKTSESDWRGIKFSAREIKFLIELQPIVSGPKAKWIPYERHEIRTCDRCRIPRVSYDLVPELKYCWSCGAEMESEE